MFGGRGVGGGWGVSEGAGVVVGHGDGTGVFVATINATDAGVGVPVVTALAVPRAETNCAVAWLPGIGVLVTTIGRGV